MIYVGDVDQDEKVALSVLTIPYIYEDCKVRKMKGLLDCKSVYVSIQLLVVHIHA